MIEKSANSKANIPILKFILNIISWTILSFLIIIALFLVYYVVSNQFYLAKGEKYEPSVSMYTIISGSMMPSIKVYDVVFDVSVKDKTSLKKGDIITFKSTSSLAYGETITHRIVDIIETDEGIKYKTKGDNNITPDQSYVEPYNILGKVIFKIPQLGRIQQLLSKAGGWLFLVLIPCLFIVLSDIFKIVGLSSTKKKIKESIEKSNVENKLSQTKQMQLKQKILENYNSIKENDKFIENQMKQPLSNKLTENNNNELSNNKLNNSELIHISITDAESRINTEQNKEKKYPLLNIENENTISENNYNNIGKSKKKKKKKKKKKNQKKLTNKIQNTYNTEETKSNFEISKEIDIKKIINKIKELEKQEESNNNEVILPTKKDEKR